MSKRKLGDEDSQASLTDTTIKDSLLEVEEDVTDSSPPMVEKAMSIDGTSEDFDDLGEKDELEMRDLLLEELEESSIGLNETEKKGHDLKIIKLQGELPDLSLPRGWIALFHRSGGIIYLHRQSRVCTWARPYHIGDASVRKHDVPLAAIPCLHQLNALKKYGMEKPQESGKNNAISGINNINNGSYNSNKYNNHDNQDNNLLDNDMGSQNSYLDNQECEFDSQNSNFDSQISNIENETCNLDNQESNFNNQDGNLDNQDGNFDNQHNNLDSHDGKLAKQDGNLDNQNGNFDNQNGNFDNQHNNLDSQDGKLANQDGNIDIDKSTIDSHNSNLDNITNKPSNMTDNHDNQHGNFDHQSSNINNHSSNLDNQNVSHHDNNVDRADTILHNLYSGRQDKMLSNLNQDAVCNTVNDSKMSTVIIIEQNDPADIPSQDDQTSQINTEDGCNTINSQCNAEMKDADANDFKRSNDVMSQSSDALFKISSDKVELVTSSVIFEYLGKLWEFQEIDLEDEKQPVLGCQLNPSDISSTIQYRVHGCNPRTKSKGVYVVNPVGKSPQSLLHEYCTKMLKLKPLYKTRESGNPKKPFLATVEIDGLQYGSGVATSKKVARRVAAQATLDVFIPGTYEKLLNIEQYLKVFDDVAIEDPSVCELTTKLGLMTPHQVLKECLSRNQGVLTSELKFEMHHTADKNVCYSIECGKYKATGPCKNKKTGRELASQALLQALHPHLKNWGSILRIYIDKHTTQKFAKPEDTTAVATSSSDDSNINRELLCDLKHEMWKLLKKRKTEPPATTSTKFTDIEI